MSLANTGSISSPVNPCQRAFAVPKRKRVLDMGLVVLVSPIWIPLFASCCLWIKLISGGKVIFRQQRIGYQGKPFTILKLRTMREGSETESHDLYAKMLIETGKPMRKMDVADGRLIKGGRLMRALGLDELPQLFNVLRGEMSLVGPRPCTPAEFENYKPAHKKRFNGLPGITGSWQVNGKNSTSFRRMVALDILYLRNFSIRSDLKVLARTYPALQRQVKELFWNSGADKASCGE